MEDFVSTYTNRLDAKGRVSIPASFRAVLAVDGFDGLYCCPTLDRNAVDAGGNRFRTGQPDALAHSRDVMGYHGIFWDVNQIPPPNPQRRETRRYAETRPGARER